MSSALQRSPHSADGERFDGWPGAPDVSPPGEPIFTRFGTPTPPPAERAPPNDATDASSNNLDDGAADPDAENNFR